MLIGIMTDSHENLHTIKKAVDIFNEKKVELVLHAGDIISPITFNEFSKLNCDMYIVFGNNDGEKDFLKERFKNKAKIFDRYGIFTLDNKKFLLYHIPDFLDILANSGEFDVIVYGHTHKQDIRKIKNTLIINPGETGTWLLGKSYICILNTQDMNVEIIDLLKQ
ncbi:MAG TPA: metallophosphoesterase [bacterium]|nr:metallophosphoesterase [bacterium]HOL47369.1 metallophosphoesterase [bacterium]HPQ18898.1 metallophosphoesterase [bacterium]